jgi:hypothetical protein
MSLQTRGHEEHFRRNKIITFKNIKATLQEDNQEILHN